VIDHRTLFLNRRITNRCGSYLRVWVTLALATATFGCKSRPTHVTTSAAPERSVSVAVVRWDAVSEQREVGMLLLTNGIQGSLEGSRLLDILVPQSQAHKAWSLLETNRLVLEKKVFLSQPPK
jgi:hypothetical protein